MNNDYYERGGGSAFPYEQKFGDGTAMRHIGMTLRDYFAAKAMQGSLAASVFDYAEIELEAQNAYAIADAMLKARKQ